MNKEIIPKWISLCDDDLDNAKIMLKNDKLLVSAYFLQQAAEKIIKAFYLYNNNDEPPYTHNLIHLEKETNLSLATDNLFSDLLIELNPYYIIARYPNYKIK